MRSVRRDGRTSQSGQAAASASRTSSCAPSVSTSRSGPPWSSTESILIAGGEVGVSIGLFGQEGPGVASTTSRPSTGVSLGRRRRWSAYRLKRYRLYELSEREARARRAEIGMVSSTSTSCDRTGDLTSSGPCATNVHDRRSQPSTANSCASTAIADNATSTGAASWRSKTASRHRQGPRRMRPLSTPSYAAEPPRRLYPALSATRRPRCAPSLNGHDDGRGQPTSIGFAAKSLTASSLRRAGRATTPGPQR